MDEITIQPWHKDHPKWSSLQALVEQLGQASWIAFHADWHLQSVMLVAESRYEPVGFLRFVIQSIGSDSDLPVMILNNKILTESKVIAFGVIETMRRKGIGRRLQEQLIHDSRQAGCYQIRSHSRLSNSANHQLKLSLGFGIHPLHTTSDKDGYYFILPL